MKMEQEYVDEKWRFLLTMQSRDVETSSALNDLNILDKGKIRNILRETGLNIATIIHESKK